ncbi:NADPH-dependent 7-cyano-7-deazaguanine reductase QueF [Gallaecimonas kandeliae]|uniref:NADPH-dependent 7-cyano-7-deazaguanine reductase QueF n=1 Tax=Gallaecimonas kandeliae TaxID=3029055 RepID=UPI00264766F6|nr:NADPH-dependent 7-cyano-7-deazaguanine reductase QueF [Gallaecimonas kandeliae]WKE64543.1 NADPH-dependent 7-cyano-7-deazaguanine reductase QueF [Gallaecimonas kandeliae]
MPKNPLYQGAKELADLPLGKTTAYQDQYDPSLLHGVPRSLNRDSLELGDSLPFVGEDIWNGYELSWLNARGKPVVALAQFRFPATSPRLVESKSFKLYLNSFNQSRFESTDAVKAALVKDLSATAGGEATVTLYGPEELDALPLGHQEGDCIDGLDIEVSHYDFDPGLLDGIGGSEMVEEKLVSHLLKSNCLITSQPDWGSVQIHYRGPRIDREKLLRYIISFRQHNEFHEQCVERIYMDLKHRLDPQFLLVSARYTRRGGLDINPWRASEPVAMGNPRLPRQ